LPVLVLPDQLALGIIKIPSCCVILTYRQIPQSYYALMVNEAEVKHRMPSSLPTR